MAKNINELKLEMLAKQLGIPIKQGWKVSLQKLLHQKKPSILSTWIKRGVPNNFDNILTSVGISPKTWEKICENIRDSSGAPTIIIDGELPIPDQPNPELDLRDKLINCLLENKSLVEEINDLKRQLEEIRGKRPDKILLGAPSDG